MVALLACLWGGIPQGNVLGAIVFHILKVTMKR